MRLIVAGGRFLDDYTMVAKSLELLLSKTAEPIEIVSGGCDRGKLTFHRPNGTFVYGTDGLGERYAHEKGYSTRIFPADWNRHGRKAGYIRNREMAEYGTHCCLFWDGISTGTALMKKLAEQYRLPLAITHYKIDQGSETGYSVEGIMKTSYQPQTPPTNEQ